MAERTSLILNKGLEIGAEVYVKTSDKINQIRVWLLLNFNTYLDQS
jgi:hypothetical protein